MSSEDAAASRQPDQYWKQLVQLRTATICIQLYRNQLRRKLRWIDLVKAFGSSGAIAGWVVWAEWPLLWSGIIAGSQLLDATRHVFPLARQHKAASELAMALGMLCIEAEVEWDAIASGIIPASSIMQRRARLTRLQLEAEHKYFPEGLEMPARLFVLAERMAKAYVKANYDESNRVC